MIFLSSILHHYQQEHKMEALGKSLSVKDLVQSCESLRFLPEARYETGMVTQLLKRPWPCCLHDGCCCICRYRTKNVSHWSLDGSEHECYPRSSSGVKINDCAQREDNKVRRLHESNFKYKSLQSNSFCRTLAWNVVARVIKKGGDDGHRRRDVTNMIRTLHCNL